MLLSCLLEGRSHHWRKRVIVASSLLPVFDVIVNLTLLPHHSSVTNRADTVLSLCRLASILYFQPYQGIEAMEIVISQVPVRPWLIAADSTVLVVFLLSQQLNKIAFKLKRRGTSGVTDFVNIKCPLLIEASSPPKTTEEPLTAETKATAPLRRTVQCIPGPKLPDQPPEQLEGHHQHQVSTLSATNPSTFTSSLRDSAAASSSQAASLLASYDDVYRW